MPGHLACFAPYVGWAGAPYAGHQFLHHYLEGYVDLGWTVTLIAPAVPRNESAARRERRHRVVLTPLRTRNPWAEARRLAHRRLPMDRAWRAHTRGPLVDPVLAGADHIEVHWAEALPLVPELRRLHPRTPLTAVAHDLGWQALQRADAAAGRGDRAVVRRSRARELALLAQADEVLCFKLEDVRAVRDAHPRPERVRCVPPHLSLPASALPAAAGPSVLFVGAWDRPENERSAMWLLDEVWGAVLDRRPDAELVLAGGSPPESLLTRAGPGVRITGYVADLTDCYRQARVVVAPLRLGAGLRFKVPQALAYGRPVVCTALAGEGLATAPGLHVEDDARRFADAVVRLLDDPEQGRRDGCAGRAWVQEHLDLARVLEQLSEERKAARTRA